ncbi:hypothetical protein ACFXKG_27725 [Streptomyces sp. NPDC059255]|uniref:hypothetical protein n=1 Tax=Streptomyces sp. NPDC059255 TaxID=3346793 RepID=UPI003681FC56
MQDRRRRTALHIPPPSGPVLLPRERQSSSTGPSGAAGSSSGSGSGSTGPSSGSPEPEGSSGTSGTSGAGGSGSGGSSDDNPFAPPPEGRPDQPWQPRRPENGEGQDGGSGRGGWGSQWSSRQPGRSSGGFGSRAGGQGGNGPHGQNGPDGPANGQDGPGTGQGGGPRWDPTDPAQRRARYALLGGLWAFFFALFDLPEIALLLGSLAVYWGASSLRARSRKPSDGTAASGAGQPSLTGPSAPSGQLNQPGPDGRPGQISTRPQTTAAVSGLLAAGLALAIVATTFTVQLVYRDYYTCVNDALTKTGQLSCNDLLPRSLEPVFGVKE